MTSYIRSPYTLSAHQRPIVGDQKTSAQNADHMGWLKCDGRTLSKNDFFFLFQVVGYNFGGSGDTFYLPDARGKVPGLNGPYTDINGNSDNFVFGTTRGEYEHKLTIPEMPSHNHGVANRTQDISNNMTSLEFTGQTLTDPKHTHGYTATNSDNNTVIDTVLVGGTESDANSGTTPATTGESLTGITLNDPKHAHRLNPAGGDEYHNNIQPTIVIGNIFMYSGKPNYPRFAVPFQALTNIL
jgi:microcystin-dependent protein